MHFFHPIQRCAQQIYHTALPLSPTSLPLRLSCLQMVIENRLSRVAAFSRAPDAWGSLQRTIDVRPRQLTCITTSAQRIIAACEETVNLYDAITFVLRQSLHAPETVTKIQVSPDGSILFFAHSSSVAIWDVQTGGLVHTFTTLPRITDIELSAGGSHRMRLVRRICRILECPHQRGGKRLRDQPVVTVHWFSPLEIAVATQNSLYIQNISVGETSCSFVIPWRVRGMVHLADGGGFLVGTSRPAMRGNQEMTAFEFIRYAGTQFLGHQQWGGTRMGRLMNSTLMGDDIVCILALPSGVQRFDPRSRDWTSTSPSLGAVTSVAVSLNRNLVVQTEDSIQIFTLDVLTNGEARNDICSPHIYPLGGNHVLYLRTNSYVTLLEFETLSEVRPDNGTPSLNSLLGNQAPPVRGTLAELGVRVVMEAWHEGIPLPAFVGEGASLSGLSPDCTRVVTVYGSSRQKLRVKEVKCDITLAELSLDHEHFGAGEIYDLSFDSEAGFHLKVDGPGWHIKSLTT